MAKDALLSVLATYGHVETTRVRGSLLGGRGEWTSFPGGCMGLPCAFAVLLATRENVDTTPRDRRPSHKPPDLRHYYASDLKVLGSFREAMVSEYAGVWRELVHGEFYELLGAGRFKPVKQSVDNHISATWLFGWTADEFG